MDAQPLALDPPDPNVKIRPVRRSDVSALRTLWPQRSQVDVEQLVNRAQQQAQHGRGLGVVAVGENSLVLLGYGQVTLWYETAEIADLVVTETERGKGVGTVLIQYLIRVARNFHASRVEIGATLHNTRAVDLYRRLGFQDGRAIVVDLGQGLEAVLYLYLDLT